MLLCGDLVKYTLSNIPLEECACVSFLMAIGDDCGVPGSVIYVRWLLNVACTK
jgi:hypothetical protein